MKYVDVLTDEAIDKKKKLFAEVLLNESSIGDEVIVVKPFSFTNAVGDNLEVKNPSKEFEDLKGELELVLQELDKVKLQRRELKKEVKELKVKVEELELNKSQYLEPSDKFETGEINND